MTIWLPRRLTSTKPCLARISHTSCPDRTRSLANGNLDAGHIHFLAQPAFDLFGRRRFQEQLQCFPKTGASLFNGVALAGNVELGAKGHEPIVLTLDDGRELPDHSGRSWRIVLHFCRKR